MTDEMRFERRMSDSDALMWGIEKDPAPALDDHRRRRPRPGA